MILLSNEGRELAMPAWVQPGHPDNSVTVYLGYGRKRAGGVGNGHGFDTYSIRTVNTPFIAGNVQLAKGRSEEHTSELQSLRHLVCRLLLEKKKKKNDNQKHHSLVSQRQ